MATNTVNQQVPYPQPSEAEKIITLLEDIKYLLRDLLNNSRRHY